MPRRNCQRHSIFFLGTLSAWPVVLAIVVSHSILVNLFQAKNYNQVLHSIFFVVKQKSPSQFYALQFFCGNWAVFISNLFLIFWASSFCLFSFCAHSINTPTRPLLFCPLFIHLCPKTSFSLPYLKRHFPLSFATVGRSRQAAAFSARVERPSILSEPRVSQILGE